MFYYFGSYFPKYKKSGAKSTKQLNYTISRSTGAGRYSGLSSGLGNHTIEQLNRRLRDNWKLQLPSRSRRCMGGKCSNLYVNAHTTFVLNCWIRATSFCCEILWSGVPGTGPEPGRILQAGNPPGTPANFKVVLNGVYRC